MFVAKTRFERVITRLGFLYYLAYNLWQRRAFRVGRALHAEVGFDLIHQATLCGYREPGYLWTLDAPFVWGPVGGTQNVPWRFLPSLGAQGAIREGVRSLTNLCQLYFGRRIRQAAHRAAVVLAANSTVQRDLRRALRVTPRRLLETGLPAGVGRLRRNTSGQPLRILWSGNLEPFKGLPLLLHALATLPDPRSFTLRILGSGSAESAWRRLAARVDIDGRIQWLGEVEHDEALAHCRWADVLVFTSLRDTSGNVVLEALQAGVPVICLDHQGARDMVDPTCGIRVPVSTPTRVAEDLAEAIRDIQTSPDALARLSRGALARAETFLWSRQMALTLDIYRDVLETGVASQAEPDSRSESAA